MANTRRNIRDMPYLRRQDGFSALDRLKELAIWRIALSLLTMARNLPPSLYTFYLYCFGVILVRMASNARRMVWQAVDPVDPRNNNRTIASFTTTECWRDLRFENSHLPELFTLLRFPGFVELDNGTLVPSEYAFCFFLYRIHYPSTLAMLQTPFGREYSQLSRIFNAAVILMDDQHRHKVMGNLAWYSRRFDMYSNAVRWRISTVLISLHMFFILSMVQYGTLL